MVRIGLSNVQAGMMRQLLDDPELIWMTAPETDDDRLARAMVDAGHMIPAVVPPSTRAELPDIALVYSLTDAGRKALFELLADA